jgi:hypothetical protein
MKRLRIPVSRRLHWVTGSARMLVAPASPASVGAGEKEGAFLSIARKLGRSFEFRTGLGLPADPEQEVAARRR